MISLKVKFARFETNEHGTNRETIKGPRVASVNILETIQRLYETNPHGGKTRAVWYKRLIFYFPSGSWRCVDLALVKSL